MKKIRILFTKPQKFNLFSTGIMWGTNATFSHVAIQIEDPDTGKQVVYQASGLAVNCVTLDYLLTKDIVVYQKDFNINDANFVKGKSFLLDQLGKQYDIAAIFGFAYQIAFLKLFHLNIKNPARSDDSQWVCSWLISQFINLVDDASLDVSQMTPEKLFAAIPSLPNDW